MIPTNFRLNMITERVPNFAPKVPGFRFSSIIMDAQKPRVPHMYTTPPMRLKNKKAMEFPKRAAPIIYNDFAEYEKQLRQYSYGY